MKHTVLILTMALSSNFAMAAEKIDFNSMITENAKIKEDLHESIRQNIKLAQRPSKNTNVQVVDIDPGNNVYVSSDREIVSNTKLNRKAMNRQFQKKQNERVDEEISSASSL